MRDRQDCIRVLTFIHDRMIHVHGENRNADYMKAMRECIDSLTPKWVPEAERLPDSSREVWVFADGDIFTAIHNHWEWVDIMDNPLVEQPTHWHEIELPEPPEVVK